jgi:hypothetical protein
MDISTELSNESKSKLQTTVTWARYAALLSIINLGLGLVQIIIGAIKNDANVLGSVFSFIISGVISLVMAVNLFKFSNLTKSSIEQNETTQLTQALYHLKVYFSIMGVLFIIMLSLLALGLLIFLIALVIS